MPWGETRRSYWRPRINTKDKLGYGGFRWVDTQAQLTGALRDSLEGLTPAFGMLGTNRAVIVLDCSETMVEAYRGTTRIEMVITAIRDFLQAPLVESYSADRAKRTGIQRLNPPPCFARESESVGPRSGIQRTSRPKPGFAYAAQRSEAMDDMRAGGN